MTWLLFVCMYVGILRRWRLNDKDLQNMQQQQWTQTTSGTQHSHFYIESATHGSVDLTVGQTVKPNKTKVWTTNRNVYVWGCVWLQPTKHTYYMYTYIHILIWMTGLNVLFDVFRLNKIHMFVCKCVCKMKCGNTAWPDLHTLSVSQAGRQAIISNNVLNQQQQQQHHSIYSTGNNSNEIWRNEKKKQNTTQKQELTAKLRAQVYAFTHKTGY